MTRWGMVFDMDRCVGCQTCTIACKQANETSSGVLWRNVLDFEVGEFPQVDRTFLLTGCQHCEEPPCVPVCPTGATWKRNDGMVVIDYDVCIGCGSCVVACPYQARTIVKEQLAYYRGHPTVLETRAVHRQRHGVAQKCTFCIGRIDDGLARGLRPGVDPAATPACAASCISKAISFGDFADPSSSVSRLVADNKAYRMHEHLGTRPFIHYIGDRQTNHVTPGPVQKVWDWRAAMNFILGGMSAGLFVVSFAVWLFGIIGERTLMASYLIAGAIMGTGLLCVLAKLGRPLRFWRVITMWQTSWMTRETFCVTGLFLALPLDIVWPQATLHAWIALMASGFLYCQARILHAAKGIPIWRERLIVPSLIVTGLFEGAALLMVVGVTLGGEYLLARAASLLMIVLAGVMAMLWLRFVPRTLLTTRGEIIAIHKPVLFFGHVTPLILVLTAALVTGGAIQSALLIVAALSTIIVGGWWKYTVIVRAAHFQGYQIPGQGSATLAAVA